ncbi:inverse autotransporter beta domain-containing protein, partial [Achromobacter spanius]|uniref:inverse autotransporter beta domain-containing protein n=1 Tax=Achromobacter spanius TaxID=217203 RepID=UPI0038242B76
MWKLFKLLSPQRLAGERNKALSLLLSVTLLLQGCAAPIASSYQRPSAEPAAAAGAGHDQTGQNLLDANNPVAQAKAAGGLEAAPGLDGQPLPTNPNQMGSDDAKSFAVGKATGEAKRVAEDWLGQFGTARLDLLGSFHGGSLDMLFPIRDTGTDLIFSQVGVRRTNLLTDSYRTTVNVGLGYRHFFDDYMVGGNAFFDQDITRGHRRLGLGGELWADYLKLSANGYFRLSGWKDSPDLIDYKERPANGFDIRAEGYLPQYPQLGGKLMFEKYYGDEVGLFGASERQKNPSAWTLGVSYTPAPAVTLGLDHRMGQGGVSDTTFKVGMKYAIGVPFAKQMDPAGVASSRKLDAMRLDLVERNNEIVLEYKKNDPMVIQLPANASGYPQTDVSFPVSISGASAAPQLEWSGSAAPFALPYSGGGVGTLRLPSYNIDGNNAYQLTASTTDVHGRKITSNVMNVSVNPFNVSVARSKAVAMADGTDMVKFTATIRGVQAEPMPSRPVAWAIKGTATVKDSSERTDLNGQAFMTLSSKVASQVEVEAAEAQGFKAKNDAEFTSDLKTAGVVQLDAAPAAILANGQAKTVLTATVQDRNGNAVGEGVAVSWTTTNGTLSAKSSDTDAAGIATIELTAGTTPGTAEVTAKARDTDPGKTTGVDFLIDVSGARVVALTPSKTTGLANGLDTVTLAATVEDAHGNPVGAGVTVNWGTSLGKLASATSATNASSIATVVLTAPTGAGMADLIAKAAAGDAGKTAAVAFTADTSTARVVTLTPSKTTGLANGTDTVTLTATVEDANGNPVGAGVTVNWGTSLGKLASASSATNASSTATVVLTAPTSAGTANLTAKAAAGDAGKTAAVAFTADTSTARVVTLTPSKTTGLANGTDTVTLTATVEDANGNPVGAGVTVNWGTSLGKLASATSATNAGSTATVVLTAPTSAGTANLTAKAAAGDAGKTAAVAFTADTSTARVVTLTPSKTTGLANGTDTLTLTATVEDANGNLVGAGVTVNWGTSLGKLASATSATNASSTATVV